MKNWGEHEKFMNSIKQAVAEEMRLVHDVDLEREPFPFTVPKPMRKGTVCKICMKNKASSRHHLIPKQTWRRGDRIITIPACKECHKEIHRRFNNSTLKEQFNTAKKIRKSIR